MFGRRKQVKDFSGLATRRETDEEFVDRMETECRLYERQRKRELIHEQLLGSKKRKSLFF